jgi:hypothetical protein
MKRVLIAVTALIACLAIGIVPAATATKKKPKRISATISLSVTVTPPGTYGPGSATYSGGVTAGGPAGCRAGRPVTISRNGAAVAQTVTQSNGTYSVPVAAAPDPGQYTASVPQKKAVKKGKKKKGTKKRKKKKFICLTATSAVVAK